MYGVPGELLKLLQCMYSEVTSSIRINEYHTRPFTITRGLRQGCVLTLFSIFINDLPDKLKGSGKGIVFGDLLWSNLLYADDLVLLAENAEDLQVLLKSLQEWCQIWDVTINPTKSAITHFRPKSHCKSTQVFSLSGEIYQL